MKYFMLLTAMALMSATLSACTASTDSSSDTINSSAEESTEASAPSSETQSALSENSESNILIAYFSRVGNTDFDPDVDAVTSASLRLDNGNLTGNAQVLANFVKERTNGDLFLIQTSEKYPSDYESTTNIGSEEKSQNSRPELSSHIDNMDNYETVVLIYPIWWGTAPMAVSSFLEEYDFTGKTILPIATHEGSGMGTSEDDIKALAKGADVKTGLSVRGGSVDSAQSDVDSWLESNGL